MELSEDALDLLDAARMLKSMKRADSKVQEYSDALVPLDLYTEEQRTTIASWYHQITKTKNRTKGHLATAAKDIGIEIPKGRPVLEKTLMLFPGLYILSLSLFLCIPYISPFSTNPAYLSIINPLDPRNMTVKATNAANNNLAP